MAVQERVDYKSQLSDNGQRTKTTQTRNKKKAIIDTTMSENVSKKKIYMIKREHFQ